MSNGAVRERVSTPPRWRKWLRSEADGSAPHNGSRLEGRAFSPCITLAKATAAEWSCRM